MASQDSHNRAPDLGDVELGEATVDQLLATLAGTLDAAGHDIPNVGAFDAQSAAVANAPSTATDVARKNEVDAKADATHDNSAHSQIAATRDLLPEGAQTGLPADATGIHYTGATRQYIDPSLTTGNRAVYLEAATASSDGDEEVTVELYDADAGGVVGSVALTGASSRTRSGELASGLTATNEVYARFNVTSASATGGATFDALAARLIVE